MSPSPSHFKLPTALLLALLLMALAALLPACGTAIPSALSRDRGGIQGEVLPTPTSTPPPTQTLPPPTPLPSATTTEWLPTPYPTSLEAFGLVYDPEATLAIPPWGSLSMLFWGNEIPVQPYLSTPQFIAQPTPLGMQASGGRLLELGCELDYWGWAACPPDNPLQSFGCTVLVDPRVSVSGIAPLSSLVAICKIETEEHEAARINGLYLTGCAFKTENHYIFEVGGEYLLVSSAEALRQMFVPIDSPQEAVSFAQLVTGLQAIYDFTYDPYLMYFHEIIQGTHVTQVGDVFEMNLFTPTTCGCEPLFTSQITLRVDQQGQVTWVDAVPVYMTAGWSCAD